MLVADNRYVELSRLLAPLSNVNAQDFRGRTALHSAISGRSPACVEIILDCNPVVTTVTPDDKNTALHTAVRFGQPESVGLILDEYPSLASTFNAAGHTPLDMARGIYENLPGWQNFMQSQNRQTGSKDDFEKIVALLSLEETKAP